MKTKILIVDDFAPLTSVVRMVLVSRGAYEVRIENRSSSAVNTALEFRPDLILMDVDMPTPNGSEVAATLRRSAGFSATPIVFLTSEAKAHKQALLMDEHFLAKPFDPQALLETVSRLLPTTEN
jgi:CheY-like chemotaxis protein